MMIPLPGATTFGDVNRSAVLAAADALGLTRRIGERELNRMTEAMPEILASLVREIESENAHYPPWVRVQLGGELRLLRTMQHLAIPDMLSRVGT